MWSRGRFDVSWSDLAVGALRCAWPTDRDALQRRVERLWSPDGDALACFSVRGALDLLLRGLELPPGSEVLFSALNVKGMLRVVTRLGLVPVPVDVELDHLAPRADLLERAITPRSRVLVVAHLFGARIELGPCLEVARRHDLVVVEDCAQAFDGLGFTGHPGADASLFSFGPLKTATALGGALARVRDPDLLARMRREQSRLPVQTRRAQLARIVRFVGLKGLTHRWSAAAALSLARLTRADLDRRLEEAARRITRPRRGPERGGGALGQRRRPSAPLLALLERRLRDRPERRVAARARAGRLLLARIADRAVCPGSKNPRHGFWLFPLLAKDPRALIAALRAEGFDAAPALSLRAVPAPEDRPHLDPVIAREFLERVVVLPCYAAMGERSLEREAAVVRRAIDSHEVGVERERPALRQRITLRRRTLVKRLGKRVSRRLGAFQGRQSLVGDPAFFDPALFPALLRIASQWRVVRAELDAVLRDWDALPGLDEISPDQARIATDGRFKAFVLRAFGFRADRNCARCPETARLVDAVPGIESAWFSMLAPGYHVPSHRGITKGMINCLVGIRIPGPAGACRIRVGDEVRRYAEGEAIVFDDTVSHEVWNDAREPRVVLLLSFRRPMRRAGRWLNALFLAALRRTAYVGDARRLFAEWERRTYAAGTDGEATGGG